MFQIKTKNYYGIYYTIKIFKDIPNNLIENVKNLFEKELNYIEEKSQGKGDLLILNKMFIQNFTQKLADFKKDSQATMFNNILDKKQEEFNELIKIKKPKTIDFEDNIDRPLLEEDLIKRLENLQNLRNINNNELVNTGTIITEIENNEAINEKEKSIEKRVNFKEKIIENIENNLDEEENFFRKLKIKEEIQKQQLDNNYNGCIEDNNKEIIKKLDKIIEKINKLESLIIKE